MVDLLRNFPNLHCLFSAYNHKNLLNYVPSLMTTLASPLKKLEYFRRINLVIFIIKQDHPSLIEIKLLFSWKDLKNQEQYILKDAFRNWMFFNDVKMQENINHKLHFAPRNFKRLWLETAMTFPTQGSIWQLFHDCLINKITFIRIVQLLNPVQVSEYFWNQIAV